MDETSNGLGMDPEDFTSVTQVYMEYDNDDDCSIGNSTCSRFEDGHHFGNDNSMSASNQGKHFDDDERYCIGVIMPKERLIENQKHCVDQVGHNRQSGIF